MTKPSETLSFHTPLNLEENWVRGLTSLEVNNFVFNVTKEKNRFIIHIREEEDPNNWGEVVLFDKNEQKISYYWDKKLKK